MNKLNKQVKLFFILLLLSLSLQAGSLPKLDITWNCGACTHNAKVIPLIRQAYRAEAQSGGRTISTTETAQVEIIDFRQRNPGTRVMLGIMAGKDRLGLRITYKALEYYTSDTSANAIQGMNHLCAAVGAETYQQLDWATKE
ncbi:MAG: hypothetical protein JAY91_15590 [Candidatus Thiodiazotropha endolucinida]|nr:hypothetical protein [Candidatus Thiodiazotropha taylori]MCW4242312.1 hypothetical protein [Candidatus Thiodiazotropha taylori]